MNAFKKKKNAHNIYIAREYLLTNDYGSIRIDEEEIFSSFEDAKGFLKTLEDTEVEDDYFLLFRREIVKHTVGQDESFIEKWTYNIKGQLIDTLTKLYDTPESSQYKCSGKYGIGDIVYIVPRIQNKLSPSIKGTYGVIVEVPRVPENHRVVDENREELQKEYTIYFITDKGLLGHLHASENALTAPKSVIPNELKFLELYSKHLKTEKTLPNNLMKQLLNDEISVLNIKKFDFENRIIQCAFDE